MGEILTLTWQIEFPQHLLKTTLAAKETLAWNSPFCGLIKYRFTDLPRFTFIVSVFLVRQFLVDN